MTLMSNFKKLFVSGGHDGDASVASRRNSSRQTTRSSLSTKEAAANSLSHESEKSPTNPPQTSQHQPVFSFNGSLNDNYPDLPASYRLVSLLGEGAFSTVYKAVDANHDDVTVAIKIISKDHLTSKQLNNIKNEITIMQRMGMHQNILKLLHYIDTPNHCFLILDYCNGGEIFNKIIEYTYFSEDLSRHVFKQLLSAIEHLHDHNIVHRDIKPENLLFNQIPYMPRSTHAFKEALRKSDDSTKVDEGDFKPNYGGGTIGVIKLADFGLAKQLPSASSYSHHQNLKTPCGTAGYTAPEVITCNSATSPTDINGGVSSFSLRKKTFTSKLSRKNYYSKAVDIWSLGCFLYTILCGFPPFYDEDPNQLTHKILNGDFEYLKPWWDEVSNDAKDLISQMINTDPETRISIDEIWQHPWVKGSTHTSGNYFGESYHEYEVHELDPFKKENDVEHVEFALESNPTSASHSPTHLHPTIPPTDNSFFGTCGPAPQPLASPRAEAIKRVFDNPAMIGSRAAASVSGVDVNGEMVSSGEEFSAKHRSSVVQFIENIEERSQDEDEDDSDSFSSSSDDHFIARKTEKLTNNLPKTPNPTKDELNKLNFKDVFKISSNYDSFSNDEENEDSEKDDKITSLQPSNSKRKNSSKTRVASTFSHDEDADLSSTNSLTDGEDEDYQTRSSSIISGINGEFKFTLNLNESNLLSRRRSSTLSKSLKKTSSNNSPSLPQGQLTSTIG